MEDFQEIRVKAAKISEYAELMGDELGEALTLLAELHYRSEYLGEELGNILSLEIIRQLGYLESTCTIVEREEEIIHKFKEKELVWVE